MTTLPAWQGQILQDFIFGWRELQLFPLECHSAVRQINRKLPEGEHRLILCFGRVAEGDPDAGKQLSHTERLGDIVVSAGIECSDLIALLLSAPTE